MSPSEHEYNVQRAAHLLEEYMNQGTSESYTVRVRNDEMFVVTESGGTPSLAHQPPWAQFDEVAPGVYRADITNTDYLEGYTNKHMPSNGQRLDDWA